MEELVITGGSIVTMSPNRQILSPGAILVRETRIADVGPAPVLLDKYPDSRRFDAGDKVILPGLINAHTHASHILLRGGPSQDRVHLDWLINVLYPAVDVYDEHSARTAYLLFCLEAISSGTTTVVDNIIWADREDLTEIAVDVYRQVGLRAIYARMFTDIPLTERISTIGELQQKEPKVRKVLFPREDTEGALLAIEDLIRKYHQVDDGLIQVWPAPGIPTLVTPQALQGSLELARKYGSMVTIHLAETQATATFENKSITQYLDEIGVLDPKLVAGHCVWMDDQDLLLLKKHQVKVVNNVVSNMYLGSGIAPIAQMHKMGITVGLGTDDVNCNDSANILADLKFAALAQKVRELDAAALTAEKVLEMATIDGARTIGLENEIGSLEIGKRADLVILDMNEPHLTPCHHIPSTLVYQARGTEVESVMVNGKWLMVHREPVAISRIESLTTILADAQHASAAVLERAGMTHLKNRGWITG